MFTNPLVLSCKFPPTVTPLLKVTPPFKVILLKVTVPVMVPPPANTTVPLPAVNVPPFANKPLLLKVNNRLLVILRVAPLWMVTALACASADEILGLLGVAVGIYTLLAAVGKTLLHQLEAVCQSVLVAPVHNAVDPKQVGMVVFTFKLSTKMLAAFEVLSLPINVVAFIVLPVGSSPFDKSLPYCVPLMNKSNF